MIGIGRVGKGFADKIEITGFDILYFLTHERANCHKSKKKVLFFIVNIFLIKQSYNFLLGFKK